MQPEMDLTAESQLVSSCLWDSMKTLTLRMSTGKLGGSVVKFR